MFPPIRFLVGPNFMWKKKEKNHVNTAQWLQGNTAFP